MVTPSLKYLVTCLQSYYNILIHKPYYKHIVLTSVYTYNYRVVDDAHGYIFKEFIYKVTYSKNTYNAIPLSLLCNQESKDPHGMLSKSDLQA